MALRVILSLVVLFSSTARAADCEDPGEIVGEVEAAVLSTRFDLAREAADRAEAAFGCTGSAEAQVLARLWLAEGAMAHVEGDSIGRDQAFASAWRVAPHHWTQSFGPDLEALWREAGKQERGRGRLELQGMAEGQTARVDGAPLPVPIDLEAGLYLVQAGEQGQGPVFSRIVMVPDEQTLVVRVEAPAGAPVASGGTATVEPERKRKGTGWYIGAGAAALLSGTSALLAVSQNGGMDAAGEVDTLDAHYGRQKAMAYGSYGLAGASALCLGIGLAW